MNDDAVLLWISGEQLAVERDLWESLEGPKPADLGAFRSNGCTASPDTVGGIPIIGRWLVRMVGNARFWPACYCHDYAYNALSVLARVEGDRVFRRDIVRCLTYDGVPRPVASVFAWKYAKVVRKLGRGHYSGQGDPAQ